MAYTVRVLDSRGAERSRKHFTAPPRHVRVPEGRSVELKDSAGREIPVQVDYEQHGDRSHDWSSLDG